jgi:hypothetical protein
MNTIIINGLRTPESSLLVIIHKSELKPRPWPVRPEGQLDNSYFYTVTTGRVKNLDNNLSVSDTDLKL